MTAALIITGICLGSLAVMVWMVARAPLLDEHGNPVDDIDWENAQ